MADLKMEHETVTLEPDDGTTETLTVREWMWWPVRERHEKRLLDAGKKDSREHAVILDRDTGEVIDESIGGAHSVGPDWSKAQGRDFCVYHNHPGGNPTLSPADVLSSLSRGATEIGAVVGEDRGMRLRFLVGANESLLAKVADFHRRIRTAKDNAELLRVADDEWRKWLGQHSANGGTGLFDIRRTEQ